MTLREIGNGKKQSEWSAPAMEYEGWKVGNMQLWTRLFCPPVSRATLELADTANTGCFCT
jgi:hypothetical protein